MTDTTRPSNGHLIEVSGPDGDRRYRIICPDNGQNCECWVECQESHRCDCEGPHDHDQWCDPDCDEDHALDCDEWLWRDGVMHGEHHQWIGSLLCIRDSGCWMPSWEIEFDQVRPNFAPGLYEFDYDAPDPDEGGCLYITEMHAVSLT